ncbi:MAG: sulfite exporter TauE/SafE family protein [Patescibacteria group bacterium]
MNILVISGLSILGFIASVSDVVAGGGNLFLVSVFGLIGLPTLVAIATMQIVTVVLDIITSLIFNNEKLVNWKQACTFAPLAMIGSYFGAHTAIKMDQQLFSYLVGGLMLLILLTIPHVKKEKVTFSRTVRVLFNKLTNKRPIITQNRKQTIILMFFTVFIGFYAGFYGGSVGTLMLLGFYFIGGASILATAATTKVIDIFMSVVASYIYFNQPDLINWQYAFPTILGGAIGSFVGINWAKKFGYKYIRILLYIIVAGSAVKFIFFPSLY